MFKIIVDTEQIKEELLQASRKIHNTRHMSLKHPGLNLLAHLYMHPDLIEVNDYVEMNVAGAITKVSKKFIDAHPEFTLGDYQNLNDACGETSLGKAIADEHRKELINTYVKE